MTQTKPTSGRSGGRAGDSGYDFQHTYVAWQLAWMLMGDSDPIVEVLWEKKSIDTGTSDGTERVHVDDAIGRLQACQWLGLDRDCQEVGPTEVDRDVLILRNTGRAASPALSITSQS